MFGKCLIIKIRVKKTCLNNMVTKIETKQDKIQ